MTYLIYLHHLLLYAALLLHSATLRCYARPVSYDTCAIPLGSWPTPASSAMCCKSLKKAIW